jgi:hypothetical protein
MNLELMKRAAKGGAVAACAVSVVVNGDKFSKGELSAADAAKKTAGDTAVGAATGAATGGLVQLLTRAIPRFMRGGAGTIAIAATAVEVTVDGVRLARGTIDGKQFARRSATNAVKSTAAWATARLGAVVGAPFGPGGVVIGTLAGAMIGMAAAEHYTSKV